MASIHSINIGGTQYDVKSTHYATCSTAASTAAKVATVQNGTFTLDTGVRVSVKFTNANSKASATLNVNSPGAKTIRWRNANLASTQYWTANQIVDFIYDGTYWQVIGAIKDNNTTYSAATTSEAGLMSAEDKTKLNNINTDNFLKKTGDWMTGPLGLTQNINYGQTLPTNAENGQIFFLEEENQNGNDYAEYRNCINNFIPGQVVCENGEDNLILSTERLQPACYVISDTFGTIIGNYQNCPVAVSGRVLVYINEDIKNIHVGDVVAAGPNGKATIMTRDEIREYPDRILGIVCSIPKEEKWNNININNRIWIKI